MSEELTIEEIRKIKRRVEADILTTILTMEENTGCRIEAIEIQRSFIVTSGKEEIALDNNVTLKMRI